jgi:hypothetical protein
MTIKEINKQKKQRKLEKKNKIKIIKEENKHIKKMLKQKNIKENNGIKEINKEFNKGINKDINKENNKEINEESNKQINNKIIKETNNKKKIKIKTSIHDVMMIQTSINNIKTKFKNVNNITLSGDLGYLTSKQYNINNKNILLITPKRKNQSIQNTNIESIKLKSRYKIENIFSTIKQNERIILRKDRKMCTFMSFIYIACAIENIKILKKYNH